MNDGFAPSQEKAQGLSKANQATYFITMTLSLANSGVPSPANQMIPKSFVTNTIAANISKGLKAINHLA